MSAQSITNPCYFRTGLNASGSDFAKNRIVKWSSTEGQIAIATAATDALAGVTIEKIYNGHSESFQTDGRAVVEAGAAVAVGAAITADSVGRGVTATQSAGATQNVIGVAVTAAAQAGDLIEVELKTAPPVITALMTVADRTALKAIAASSRYDGMLVLVLTDNSMWRFNAAAAQTEDRAVELVATPAAGTGRWHRANASFVMKIPIDFNVADAFLIETIPEGFAVRLAATPWWEVAVGFTGGSSSAIGISTDVASYNTKGDILGGAAGDVAATLTAGIAAGTVGPKTDTIAELHALLLEEGQSLRFDRITSAFTAGSGFVRVPVVVASAPATP